MLPLRHDAVPRLQRSSILFCTGVMSLYLFLDATHAPHLVPYIWVIRLLWIGFLLLVWLMLAKASAQARRWLLLIAGGGSPLFYGAIVAVLGSITGPHFAFMLAVPLCVKVLLVDEVEAVVASAVTNAAAGLAVLFLSHASGQVFIEWAACVAGSGVVGIYAAVTHRRRRLAEREALEAEQVALGQLRVSEERRASAERLALVGQLAAGVAHEINNPLAFVKANVQYLKSDLGERGAGKGEVHTVLTETVEGIDRIASIVKDLKAFSRGPDDASNASTCELSEAVDEALRLSSVRLKGRVILHRELAASLPPVLGSAQRVCQVLLNLLVNAADAVEERHGVGPGSVWVRGKDLADGYELWVEDNGPGIPAEVLPRLFQPFFTTKPPGKGTGLGLALCKEFVERVGGELRAENRAEGGARFVLRLAKASALGHSLAG